MGNLRSGGIKKAKHRKLAGSYSDAEVLDSSEWNWGGDMTMRSVNPSQNSVLVVDDDPEQLKFLSKIIERAGYKVIKSESATEALGVLEGRPVDVIVSDYKMPEMNGFEFLQAVRGIDGDGKWCAADVPVIMLTACGDDLEFVALERGADMFCEKFRADSLLVKQIRFLLEM
jgi:CheY-like chemotaxis protein